MVARPASRLCGDPLIRNYPWYWRAWEGLQGLIMGSDWPAQLASAFGPATVQLSHEEITLAKSLGASPSLRIGFAADLHAGPTTPASLIEAACTALQAAAPDLILLGGDFVSLRGREMERLFEPLRRLSAPLGVFAVLGNHDHWVGAGVVRSVLERSGVALLENDSCRLGHPFNNTVVVGLDDHMSGWPDASKVAWDADAATILLVHQPSGILDAVDRPFDLAFAGHTHAGQIVLPGGLALIAPPGQLSRRYLVGRHSLMTGQTLLVTRGVGNTLLPIRYRAPSEVVICTIRSTASAPAPNEAP